MMKRVLACCMAAAMILGVNGASAKKPIELGVKGGLTLQSADMEPSSLGGYRLSTDSDVGFQLGFMARINLVLLHVQPELNWNLNYYTLNAVSRQADLLSSDVRTSTVEVPVLLSMKLLPFIRLQAGPVFNLMSESRFTNDSNDKFQSISTDKSPVSYAVGVGLDLFSVNFDVRYNGEFSRSRQHIVMDDGYADFDTRLNSWAFSIGYLF